MMTKARPKDRRKPEAVAWYAKKTVAGPLVFLIAFFIYSNTFKHGYVLDDLRAVENNKSVQKGIKGVPSIFTHAYDYGYDGRNYGLYRPMSLASFAVEKSLFGNNPHAFHVIHVLLYAFSCLLLYFVLRRVLRKYNRMFALLAALLYTCHPLHTEVVANLKSRDELLAFLWLTVSLLFLFKYTDKNKNIYLAASALSFLFSLFSKESSLTYLFVYPLVLWFFTDLSPRRIFTASCAMLVPVLIFLTVLFASLDSLETSGDINFVENSLVAAPDSASQWASKIYILGKYLLMNFSPSPLLHDYSYNEIPNTGFSNWSVWLIILMLGGLAWVALSGFRKKNIFSFCIFFFFITLSVTSNFVFLIRWTFGERFLFTPGLAVCIALPVLLAEAARLVNKDARTSKNMYIGLSGLYILLFIILTVSRNPDWKSNRSLFEADMIKAPDNLRIPSMLGLSYYDLVKKDPVNNISLLDKSIEVYKKSFAIRPVAEYTDGLGNSLYLKGEYVQQALHDSSGARSLFEDARQYYRYAVALNPKLAGAWHDLGIAYTALSQIDSATYAYQQALSADPLFYNSVVNLANMYMMKGNYDLAIRYTGKALNLSTENQSGLLRNLAIIYNMKGLKDSSEYYLQLSKK